MDIKKVKYLWILILFWGMSVNLYSESIQDAISLMEKSNYIDSIKVLDKLIAENPNYAVAYTYRGYAFMMSEKYEKALSDYETAYEMAPTIETITGMQWALLANKRNEESIAYGNRILEIDPTNYYAKQRIADAYLGKKEYAVAGEKYRKMKSEYGPNADLLWKIGLCEYYSGNFEEAKKIFQDGNRLSPEHKGIQYSLENFDSINVSTFDISPEFSSFDFRGSDFIGSGQRSGLGISYSPNADWNVRAHVSSDYSENLNSTKGIVNYIIDPLNFVYLEQYGYLKNQRSVPSYYLNNSTNVYNLYTLASEKNYATNKYAIGISYRLTDRFSLHLTPQTITSNSSLLNGGAAGQIGLSYTDGYTLTFSATGISLPKSKGGQGTVSLYYPFMTNFYSTSTLTGQSMNTTTTETKYIAFNPIYTTSEDVTKSKTYGFYQQEFGYFSGFYFFGIGGRYGTARTPFMGENWIYTEFDLLQGGFGNIGIKMDSITFQLQYSQDRWLDSRNEKPSSQSIKLMLTWRL